MGQDYFAGNCQTQPDSGLRLISLIETFKDMRQLLGRDARSGISNGNLQPLGIGLLGVSLAFGLTVLTMAYAIGHISGCHLNPAVSIGLWAGGRFPAKDLAPYIVAQVLGAILAGGVREQPTTVSATNAAMISLRMEPPAGTRCSWRASE